MTSDAGDNLLWKRTEWREKALAWAFSELGRLGLPPDGPPEQFHITFWSTVIRIPVRNGEEVYFKAVPAGRMFETRLTQLLSARHPHMLPALLAVHPAEAWMLCRDMGRPLRESLRAGGGLAPLEQALPVFAEIQMESILHTAEYAALGVAEQPVGALPGSLARMLEDRQALSASEYALSAAQIDRLAALQPLVTDMSAELAAGQIPPAIHHDDLHDANIFLKDGQLCFSDWGDASISHPFFSLLILFRSVSDSLNCKENDTRMLKLRDIYLRQWVKYESMDRLRRLFSLAWRLGMINRAYAWYTDLQRYPQPYQAQYAYTVPGWLSDFIETMQMPPEEHP
jgi:hypothetical protein